MPEISGMSFKRIKIEHPRLATHTICDTWLSAREAREKHVLALVKKVLKSICLQFLLIILILIRIASKGPLDRATTFDYRVLN